MKICLTGGGTGGSVTPLIALKQEIEKRDKGAGFIFIAGKEGPEESIVQHYGIACQSIGAGKLRRYFSLKNFTDIAKTTKGYFQARSILKKNKPKIVLSAGSYVAVPVILAAWELGIKTFIHQQDYRRGLANRIMSPFASRVTVTFRKSLRDFPKDKTVLTGNPVRPEVLAGDRDKALKYFRLDKHCQTLLVIGGGTGAIALNKLIAGAFKDIIKKYQVIHLCGSGKQLPLKNPRYHPFDFLQDELKEAYAIADLVISRAGMGVLSELSALGMPSIIIPYPKSHQVENAKMFEDAALVFKQESLNPQKLYAVIKELIQNNDKLDFLSRAIKETLPRKAREKIVDLIYEEIS